MKKGGIDWWIRYGACRNKNWDQSVEIGLKGIESPTMAKGPRNSSTGKFNKYV